MHAKDKVVCVQRISVPSSSGRSLQKAWRSDAARLRVHFSPLFIGEVPSKTRFAARRS